MLVDLRAGSARRIGGSGCQLVLPGVREVHTLARSAVGYVMRWEARGGREAVRRRAVRAREGARSWFDRVSIQYALDATRPERALLDCGPGDGCRGGLVDAFARSVLQDDFGRVRLDPADARVPSPLDLQALANLLLGESRASVPAVGLGVR